MEKKFKTVIFVFFLFWAVSATVLASLKPDAGVEATLEKTIRTKCQQQFPLIPSATSVTHEKSRSVSMITLTKLNSDRADAFLKKGFVTGIPQNNLSGRSLIPSYSGLDVVIILLRCLSPFPVRLDAEFLTEKGEKDFLPKNTMDSVDGGFETNDKDPNNLYVDSLLVKVNTTFIPPFLNTNCVLQETPPAPMIFASRFTFSLKLVSPGNLDIRPDNLSMRYYAEMASESHTLKLCAYTLPWNTEDPEQWLLDVLPTSTPKAASAEEKEDAPNTWLLVIFILSILIFMTFGGIRGMKWRQAREIARRDPEALEMVCLGEETEEEEDRFLLWYNWFCQFKGPRAADEYPLFTLSEETSFELEWDEAF